MVWYPFVFRIICSFLFGPNKMPDFLKPAESQSDEDQHHSATAKAPIEAERIDVEEPSITVPAERQREMVGERPLKVISSELCREFTEGGMSFTVLHDADKVLSALLLKAGKPLKYLSIPEILSLQSAEGLEEVLDSLGGRVRKNW